MHFVPEHFLYARQVDISHVFFGPSAKSTSAARCGPQLLHAAVANKRRRYCVTTRAHSNQVTHWPKPSTSGPLRAQRRFLRPRSATSAQRPLQSPECANSCPTARRMCSNRPRTEICDGAENQEIGLI